MKLLQVLAAMLAAAVLTMSPAYAQKLGALPLATTVNGADKIPASQGGTTTVAITPSLLATYLASTFQPNDADLSAIAALSTQAFGRSLLTSADADAARTSLGLGAASGGTAWTAYTPTLSCGSGTLTSATAAGRYKQIGKTVWVHIKVAITTNGTCSPPLLSSVPIASANISTDTIWPLYGKERGVTGKMLQGEIYNNSTVTALYNYDTSFPSANGSVLNLDGVYEIN